VTSVRAATNSLKGNRPAGPQPFALAVGSVNDPLVHHLLRHGMVFSAAVGLSDEQLSLAVVMRDEGDSVWLVHSGVRNTRLRGHNRSSSPHIRWA